VRTDTDRLDVQRKRRHTCFDARYLTRNHLALDHLPVTEHDFDIDRHATALNLVAHSLEQPRVRVKMIEFRPLLEIAADPDLIVYLIHVIERAGIVFVGPVIQPETEAKETSC